jgi:ABC-type lipoprotein release transport system permease subunit
LIIRGTVVIRIENLVEDLPGFEKTAGMRYGFTHLKSIDNPYGSTNRLVSPTPEYYDTFPEIFTIYSGRLPLNESEIALDRDWANELEVEEGDSVNYTDDVTNELTVVGLYDKYELNVLDDYSLSESSLNFGSGIVVTGLIVNFDNTRFEIHADVDRSRITPFDVGSSQRYLDALEESVKALDFSYNPPEQSSDYYVVSYLAFAIESYLSWVNQLRTEEIRRTAGILILSGLVTLLSVRYNISERKLETQILLARGASKNDISRRVLVELFGLAFIGCLLGVLLGLVLSRFALSSVDFFVFETHLFWREPFLISVDSLGIAVFIGIVIPLLLVFLFHLPFLHKPSIGFRDGRVGRITGIFSRIHWDLLLIVASMFTLVTMTVGGISIIQNPILAPIITLAPYSLFIGLASLVVKMMEGSGNLLSRVLSPFIGKIPASVGVRRIGRTASSSGSTIMVLVLAMSLAWTHAAVGLSLKETKTYQARFAMGADVKFALSSVNTSGWVDFERNVTAHELTVATTIMSLGIAFLSMDVGEAIDLVALSPENYSRVGYDSHGRHLEQSSLNSSLEEMCNNPAGVILTSDIASEHGLFVGDSLRVRVLSGTDTHVFVLTILNIVEALSNCRLFDTGMNSPWRRYVGKRVIWVNRDYLMRNSEISFRENSILCARTAEGTNSTKMAEDVLGTAPENVVETDWISKDIELETFIESADYRVERAIDTMIIIAMLIAVPGILIVYFAENLQHRVRELAILKSMGASQKQITFIYTAEMIILTLISLGLLIVFGSFNVYYGLLTYRTTSYIFPIPMVPVVPWIFLMGIVLSFLASISSFIIVLVLFGLSVNLAEQLNAKWSEATTQFGEV